METETILASLGLVLDIVGAILLFIYWLPKKIDYGGIDQRQKPASVQTHAGAKLGLGLLMIGFTLQLAGNLCGA